MANSNVGNRDIVYDDTWGGIRAGETKLGKAKGRIQEIADDLYDETIAATHSGSLFFDYYEKEYKNKLEELLYRVQCIAYGAHEIKDYEENKKLNILTTQRKETLQNDYSLFNSDFATAIHLFEILEEAAQLADEETITKYNAGWSESVALFAEKYNKFKTFEEIEEETAITEDTAITEETAESNVTQDTITPPISPNGGGTTRNFGGNKFTQATGTEDKSAMSTITTSKTDAKDNDTSNNDTDTSDGTSKREPTKDTDTKDSDKTFENKPKPDNPPTISDNKGSSGVSHGGLSSNNGNGNYTFTNSGISTSQDEPIEILTDEKPGDDQITSLPDDNEDIYTIPTDLSGVTSTKKHSSGGGSGVIPILGGLGAAAAVGVGAKIYMDNKKNNDNDEDSSESNDNSEDWNETSNENDGILADEWNEDDSNFEFDDSEPNMDDDESGFSEI